MAYTWKNFTADTLNGTVETIAAKLGLAPSGTDLALSLSCSPASFTVAPNATVTVTFTASQAPGYVTYGPLKLNFKVLLRVGNSAPFADNGTRGQASYENMYVVDSTPKGNQVIPWIDLLQLACGWARGRTGEQPVCKALTQGAFDDAVMYDTVSGGLWADPEHATPFASTYFEYDLESFLDNFYATNTPQMMMCADASGLLKLLCDSVGFLGRTTIVHHSLLQWQGGTPDDIITGRQIRSNSVLRANSITGSWETFPWTYHQYVLVSGLAYDACAAHSKDLSGAAYNQPPKVWPEYDYMQKPFGSPAYLGLLNGFTNPEATLDVHA